MFTFLEDGQVNFLSGSLVEVFMVGGGGSGGGRHGGGGGGGGVLEGVIWVNPGVYQIKIGAGGPAVICTNVAGKIGGDTTAFGATAFGGGGVLSSLFFSFCFLSSRPHIANINNVGREVPTSASMPSREGLAEEAGTGHLWDRQAFRPMGPLACSVTAMRVLP